MAYLSGDSVFEGAIAQWRAAQISDAELVACYLSRWVQQKKGSRAFQGKWGQDFRSTYRGEYLSLLSQNRLWKAEKEAISALLGWSEKRRPGVLYFRKLTNREVLDLQAKGYRCVSLIEDDIDCGMFEDPYDFTRHDLCHLEKFYAKDVYFGQVGFCHVMTMALSTQAWQQLETGFDSQWETDRDYVFSDMNGSVVFLLSMLKMKIKMAVRRARQRELVQSHEISGALSIEELERYSTKEELLFQALGLPNEMNQAASVITTTREHRTQGQMLQDYFEQIGREVCEAK